MSEPIDNTHIRVKVTKTDDSQKQQRVQVEGRYEEKYGDDQQPVHRVQSYGFSAHAPAGSIGYVIIVDSNNDKPLVIALEHPDHRPKNLAEGESKMYDDQDQIIYIKRDQILIKSPKKIVIDSGEEVHIKAATDIILEPVAGHVLTGGPDASRPASAQGTVDDAGDIDISNFATKVLLK